MNFLTADDMSAILAVKLRKRLGFGMWTKLHLTGMHVEGKVMEFIFCASLDEIPCFIWILLTLEGVDWSEVPSSMAFSGAFTCLFCRATLFPNDC